MSNIDYRRANSSDKGVLAEDGLYRLGSASFSTRVSNPRQLLVPIQSVLGAE
jgi:hypothetical protein